MNFDDKYTQDFEKKFQSDLKMLLNITPDEHHQLCDDLKIIYGFLEKMKIKPHKSPQDLELISDCNIRLEKLSQTFDDMKLIAGENLYRKSLAYYANVKMRAKQGNSEAIFIYNELKPHFEKFNTN